MRDSFSDLYIIYQIKWLSPFHYWDQMDHNSQWVYYNTSPHLATLYMRCIIGIIIIIMFHVFFLSHLSRWVPLFSYAPTMCAVSVILVIDLYTIIFSPLHYWEHMEHNSQWVYSTLYSTLWYVQYCLDCTIVCLCFLLPATSGGESHTIPCAPVMCALSMFLIIAIWLSCFLWECMHGT